ncbi:MAG: glycosyltransferase [Acidimicrobiia bacterium]
MPDDPAVVDAIPQPRLDLGALDRAGAERILAAVESGRRARADAEPIEPSSPHDGDGEQGPAPTTSPPVIWSVPDASERSQWAARQWGWTEASLHVAAARPAASANAAPLDGIDGLRVLLVCHEGSRTGAPLAALAVAERLVAHGARLSTLLLVDGPLRAELAALGPVHVATSGTFDAGALGSFDVVYANTVVAAAAVAPLAESGRPVVVHTHELGRAIEAIGADAIRRGVLASRAVVAVSAGTEAAMRRLLWPFDRRIIRSTEPLLEQRLAVARELGPRPHLPTGRGGAARPDGFAPDGFARGGSAVGRFAVGGFGTFCSLKGGDLLARVAVLAAAEAAAGHWSVSWLGGTSPEADALLRAGGAAPDAHPLRLLGEHAEPLSRLRELDVLALLSRQDSYPLAMLEAALVGVPTLAQAGSGGPEEFARSGGAAVVEAERPDLVLEALRALEAAPALRALMAAAGRRHVLAHNRVDRVARDVATALLAAVRPSVVRLDAAGDDRPAQLRPTPSVSIVIPVFNRADMTERCLRRLARTVDPADVELIVVDNGSTDGSAELVERLWPGAVVLRNPENRGFAKGCNQGVRAARSERVVLLNNDTEPCDGWLEALLSRLDEPDVGLVAPKLLFPDGTIQHAGMSLVEDRKHGLALNAIHDHYRAPASTAAADRGRDLQLVTGAVLALRRATFDAVGGFDEGYWNGCEDVDLCLALAAAGYRVVYEPSAVLVHHESASGAERWTKVNDNLRRLARKWAGRVRPDLLITEAGHVVPLAIPSGPVAEPAGAQGCTVALDGAVFGYHSLSQVNRELAVRLVPHGIGVVARSAEVPELTAALDERLAPIVASSSAAPGPRPAVTIRHQWPPDWSAPADDSPLVIVQPWEFGGLPDEWIEPIRMLADEVWCYTSWVRDCYLRSGIPADRLRVLPIGVDATRFRSDGAGFPLRTRASVRLLFVGGLIHRKGIDVLLDAYGRAFSADDDVCLVVKSFGADGVYRHSPGAALLREALARPDGPEIDWIDRDLDQAEMAALYRSCDVLVHPYRGEGFGMPIAEAMASGLPVVVTDDGAARDFCDETVALLVRSRRVAIPPGSGDLPSSSAGYWFAEPDVDSLVAHLRRIVEDGELRASLGAAGRARVLAQLDWTAIAGQAAHRLQALAARPARRVLAADPYRPDAPPHPLDDTRSRTLLVVAGEGHPGWPRAAAAAAAAIGADDDVTVVVAVADDGAPSGEATLAALEDHLGSAAADVLVEIGADDGVLAGLLVRCDATVVADPGWASAAARCGTATVAADARAVAAWVRGGAAAGRAA